MKDPAGNIISGGNPENNGWYSGYNYWNGKWSAAPGEFAPGNPNGSGTVSEDVVAQTNPNNVAYINQQRASQNLPALPKGAGQPVTPTPNTPTPASGSTANISSLFGNNASSTLNLPSMYTDLSTKAGIPDLQKKADAIQAQIDQITNEQGGAISNNNENPFLSEANRVGRESKINTDAQNQIDALTNEKNTILGQITSAQTDINNQLGLATQQYNINDQQKQEALGQFNTLMSSGLLGNLSGSDVATIAQSTGLPTSVIQDAITKSQQANVSPQMVTDPNSGTITMIDANTGNIINQTKIPGWTGGSTLTATQQKDQEAAQNRSAAIADIQAGFTLQEIINNYTQTGSGLTADELYNLYNQYSPRGAAKETLKQVKAGTYATQSSFVQDPTAPGYVKPKSSGLFGL